jgi:hypothetical protein
MDIFVLIILYIWRKELKKWIIEIIKESRN